MSDQGVLFSLDLTPHEGLRGFLWRGPSDHRPEDVTLAIGFQIVHPKLRKLNKDHYDGWPVRVSGSSHVCFSVCVCLSAQEHLNNGSYECQVLPPIGEIRWRDANPPWLTGVFSGLLWSLLLISHFTSFHATCSERVTPPVLGSVHNGRGWLGCLFDGCLYNTITEKLEKH